MKYIKRLANLRGFYANACELVNCMKAWASLNYVASVKAKNRIYATKDERIIRLNNSFCAETERLLGKSITLLFQIKSEDQKLRDEMFQFDEKNESEDNMDKKLKGFEKGEQSIYEKVKDVDEKWKVLVDRKKNIERRLKAAERTSTKKFETK